MSLFSEKALELQDPGSLGLEVQIFFVVLGEIAGVQHIQNKVDGFFSGEVADLGIQPFPAGHGKHTGGVLPQQIVPMPVMAMMGTPASSRIGMTFSGRRRSLLPE